MDNNTAIRAAAGAGEFARAARGYAKTFRAPGRVNLIGEHTDHSDGLALPTTTARYTWIAAKKRIDSNIRVETLNLLDVQLFGLDALVPNEGPDWVGYVKGIAAELRAAGIAICGADLLIYSEIPIGGGLSSSAALEVGVALAFLDLANARLEASDIARLCRRAEQRFAGVNCGIMDQFAVACCERGKAVRLDCRSLEAEQEPIPADARLLIIDSGVNRKLVSSRYNSRIAECDRAAAILASHLPDLRTLRDLSPAALQDARGTLGDTLYRRCRHVVTENRRVEDAFAALQEGDLHRLGELISECHASLRDDFDASCDEVESLIEIADATEGVLGSRIVGAGFGGCVLALTRADRVDRVADGIRRAYGKRIGRTPWMHVVQPTLPAGPIGLR